jgi:uncharacterized protein (DUF433 family)
MRLSLTQKLRSGRPVIRGTGIMVSTIILAHTTGDKLTPEQIATPYRLELGQVYTALAYYYLHRNEVDAQIQSDEDEAEKLLSQLDAQGKLVYTTSAKVRSMRRK